MKFEEITPALVRRALDLYLGEAYGEDADRHRPALDLSDGADLSAVLRPHVDASRPGGEEAGGRRYAIRLGNARYPFMKLVLQEVLVVGEFFFAIDTHDDMDIRPHFPDYEAWQQLKRWNGELRRRIETQWRGSGIPTQDSLKEVIDRLPAPDARRTGTILVVDDEPAIAAGVGALLEHSGYRVLQARDGREALEIMELDPPDLVLCDYEMPHLDGLGFCREVRKRDAVQKTPILLATSCLLSLEQIRVADGFLVKPYQKEVLFQFLQHLLKEKGSGPAAGPDPFGAAEPSPR